MRNDFRLVKVFICVTLCVCAAFYAVANATETGTTQARILVTEDNVNVRTGPGISYPVINKASKGERLPILATLGDWYVSMLSDGSIGVISSRYAVAEKSAVGSFTSPSPTSSHVPTPTPTPSFGLASPDEVRLFELTNSSRVENSLPPYVWDSRLNELAKLKASDMAVNKYFGHMSDNYGTPFTMLKQYGVFYKNASENIAIDKSIDDTHNRIMENPSYRYNVLNTVYNKMGVGIVTLSNKDKIIVQLFIQD